ncbi:MAG: Ubiquinone/menaquinone biosynthesis methyltransferase ubiE [Actinomycetota bacterium]|jgi:ubiquinone/menaquinone biosynthesis C-methylase UbiE
MSWYHDRVLPRVIDVACSSKALGAHRRATLATTRGTVAEIGFGSGTNLPYYPATVDRVLAVEPAAHAVELAAGRIGAAPFPVEVVGLDGEHLPLADASVDAVVSTFTLCTIPRVEAALAEVRRVLRPGGTFHVLEHGLADDDAVRRWQRRVEPVQYRLAGGCHTTRDVPALLSAAGFEWSEMHRWYAGRPRTLMALTRVVATVG